MMMSTKMAKRQREPPASSASEMSVPAQFCFCAVGGVRFVEGGKGDD